MEVIVTVDNEEPLDLEGALGHIKIVGDAGAVIRDSNVYVDDWLVGLAEGVQAISRGESEHASDIISEPYPLIFRSCGQGFSVSYADAKVSGVDIGNFQIHLKAVIRRVLGEFGGDLVFAPDSFWAQLERYAKE